MSNPLSDASDWMKERLRRLAAEGKSPTRDAARPVEKPPLFFDHGNGLGPWGGTPREFPPLGPNDAVMVGPFKDVYGKLRKPPLSEEEMLRRTAASVRMKEWWANKRRGV